ncbi:hypothetical protein AS9A_1303 [Hoyosella subflava DQS3-9A1]|uniref:Uncharacterized protein n=1 Tax=Hoyosella subflava (strain DSM 45089 / JCM 17490 / NBRC 109087 / DQS3-9A1) TaxID=443218 RepID=F6EFE1_HOYSD|nr:hypothetical protein AS9A_1303 [Hoyosella subflava DQS3-9A1]
MGILSEEEARYTDHAFSPDGEELAIAQHLMHSGNWDMQTLCDIWERQNFVRL